MLALYYEIYDIRTAEVFQQFASYSFLQIRGSRVTCNGRSLLQNHWMNLFNTGQARTMYTVSKYSVQCREVDAPSIRRLSSQYSCLYMTIFCNSIIVSCCNSIDYVGRVFNTVQSCNWFQRVECRSPMRNTLVAREPEAERRKDGR
jgi:hypothetical protein